MGNTIAIGGKKKLAKIIKIDGESFKVESPITAMDVLKDYPTTCVLLESESVKKFGIRALKLQPEEELKPKKIYFLVDLPKFPEEKQQQQPRITRVRSAVHTSSAKDRLERLMLRQRSASELGSGYGSVRVKMRVPKAQIEKLMEESRDEGDVAERIVDLCLQNNSTSTSSSSNNNNMAHFIY
ncbi:hypothetical protein ACJIZ3_002323 [Penstemon smallii]|uniref:Uncharacterized protein n=1 Tax=Penstemon smallii TaxID=265156 RepID=A0ABD3U7G7_9LAMI